MRIYALLILCVLFWSGNFVLGRFVASGMEPWELAFFRWMCVALVMLPFFFLHVKNIFKTLRSHFWILLVLAMLGITSFNTLLYIGLTSTTATNALLINSSIPILILLFSFLILRAPMGWQQIAGIVLSTLGVVFLVLKGDWHTLRALSFNHGDLWVIASSICWALYSVMIKFAPKTLSNMEFMSTTVMLGIVMLLPFYLAQGYTLEREWTIVAQYYWAILYVALFASIMSYYLWHVGIVHIGAGKTGQFAHLMPIFGSILAYFFLDERLEWYHLEGIALIGVGLYLCLVVRRRPVC